MLEKQDFPVEKARRYLEPGPVLLISSCCGAERNVMTLGWHMILSFSPSLVALMISRGNRSHRLIRDSGECVINLPTRPLLDTVCRIGNTSGTAIDKFEAFGLTTAPATHIAAPLIADCHACFECRIHDDVMIPSYDLFVFEIVKAHVLPEDAPPELLHYTGDGVFRASRETIARRKLFRAALLER